jgi:hypothetical protein
VVLFGDSHAGVWFPALQTISGQQHWRLVDLTKDGCSAADVAIAAWFRDGAPYWECSLWRTRARAQIIRLHPSLVVMSEARYIEEPEARPMAGVPDDEGSAWLDGLAATFAFLRRWSTHVVFISDVPTLSVFAPACVSSHKSDVRPCTTSPIAATLLPDVKAAELRLAKADRVTAIDPTPWFCTPTTCPVIVDHMILYRDNAHMVPAWSRFIAPVLADSIVPIMGR